MPKNSSARRRRRIRRISEAHGVSYTAAVRLGNELARKAQVDKGLRPPKIDIDGVQRYWRREDAESLGQDGLTDPTQVDVVAAADLLLPQVRSLRSAKLKPTVVVIPTWQRERVTQSEFYEQFPEKVRDVLDTLERVREDADIAWVEWRTVAMAVHHVQDPLSGLQRITDGWLRERVDAAVEIAELLSIAAEAVHSRGCLLGARRSRAGSGYSPCGSGDIRVRVRIFDDETTVTPPGCFRHAAEEIVHWDFEVEDGYTGVEIMGGLSARLF